MASSRARRSAVVQHDGHASAPTSTGGGVAGRDALVLTAATVLSLAVADSGTTVTTAAALLGTAALVWAVVARAVPMVVSPWLLPLLTAVAAGHGLLVATRVETTALALVSHAALAVCWMGASIAATVADGRGSRARWLARSGVWLLMATVVLAAVAVAAEPPRTTDVQRLHRAATEQLRSGGSPYSGLEVDDGSPFAPADARISGYPYPPVTLAWYAAGTALAGAPRWAGLVAWLAGLALAEQVLRRRLRARPGRATATLALLAAVPNMLYVVARTWTEPFTLAVAALAAVLWWRGHRVAGVVVGILLASKQYLVVAAPALLGSAPRAWRRALLAVATAAVSVVGALLADAAGVWRWMVVFHLERPPRPDSSNLFGLLDAMGVGWAPPGWLAVLAALTLAGWLSRRAVGPGAALLASAASLAVFFALAGQAFANYWSFVAGLTVLAVASGALAPPQSGAG